MASFVTPANGDDALAEHIAQLTEDFSGLRNIPIGLTGINDAAAYAQTIKNAGTGSKGLIIYAADGTTVLLQVDATGVSASRTGGAAERVLTTGESATITPAMLAATAWTAFTPGMDQGVGLTVTVNYARYLKLGKGAWVEIGITITSAGSGGSALVLNGIPAAIAPLRTGANAVVGTFYYHVVGSGTRRVGAAYANTSASLQFYTDNQGGSFGAAPAVTAANGDVVTIKGFWEIA